MAVRGYRARLLPACSRCRCLRSTPPAFLPATVPFGRFDASATERNHEERSPRCNPGPLAGSSFSPHCSSLPSPRTLAPRRRRSTPSSRSTPSRRATKGTRRSIVDSPGTAGFGIAWQRPGAGGPDVVGNGFDPDGTSNGDEGLINTFTTGRSDSGRRPPAISTATSSSSG